MTDPSTDPGFGSAWSAARARASESQLREWLDFALTACDAADDVARRHFRRDLDLERKPDRSFVTVADRAIELEIRDGILARWPDHGLVGEEYGEAAGGRRRAGTSTPSMAPTTSFAACRCSGRCSPWSTTARCRSA